MTAGAARTPDPRLLDLVPIDREYCGRRLANFVRRAWHILEPGRPLLWGWHIDALCDHTEAVLRGQIRNLLVAVPPGTCKSLITAVFGPAWQWGPARRPNYRVICASYSGTLSTRDSRRCRNLVRSDWYQERWSEVQLAPDQDMKTKFETTETGARFSSSVGGTVTGERADLVVCDDLLSVQHGDSEAHRRAASEFFWEVLPTRFTLPEHRSMILIAQRLHQADPLGEVLEREPGEWEKLVLPLEFEPGRRAHTSLGFVDPRTEEGEVLHPEVFPPAEVQRLKTALRHAAAGQLQQRPAPREGALLKAAWFARRYQQQGASPTRIIQSWDCASKAKTRNDPSACLTIAEFPDHLELWDALVARLEFPDLLRRIQDQAAAHSPHAVLIEDKDSGQQAIQQLRRDTRLPVVAINPGTLDKFTRMSAETATLEAGNLWLPDSAPWVAHLLDEWLQFPAAAHDDQVDALSQALKWIRGTPRHGTALGPVGSAKTSNRL